MNNKISRCNRRMLRRLESAIKGYHLACESDKKNGSKGYTVPGSQKRW